jgi:hypothetical protein
VHRSASSGTFSRRQPNAIAQSVRAYREKRKFPFVPSVMARVQIAAKIAVLSIMAVTCPVRMTIISSVGENTHNK